MRTKSPDQFEAEYNWLTPAEVAPMLGYDTPGTVRELIRAGHLEAMDVSRGKRPSYRISPRAVEKFKAESRERVGE